MRLYNYWVIGLWISCWIQKKCYKLTLFALSFSSVKRVHPSKLSLNHPVYNIWVNAGLHHLSAEVVCGFTHRTLSAQGINMKVKQANGTWSDLNIFVHQKTINRVNRLGKNGREKQNLSHILTNRLAHTEHGFNSTKTPNNPVKNYNRELNRYFSEDHIQMTKAYNLMLSVTMLATFFKLYTI